MKWLAPLLRDERGDTASVLGFSLTWFVTFSVFMMNVQLGQLFHRRDAVDHAAAIAADTAKKTYCQKQENLAATESEAKRLIEPTLETAGSAEDCKVTVAGDGESQDPGAKSLSVSLQCSFECKIPIASSVMCKNGRVQFDSKLKTTALGCDGKGS